MKQDTLNQLLSELQQRQVQLWLETGEESPRLRYRASKDRLTPELLLQMKQCKSELIRFLQQAQSSSPRPPLQATEARSLSFAQQRLWFLHQFEPDSSSNNMPVVVRFTGELEVDVLHRSLQEVVRRHAVLRSRFPKVDGQPTVVVEPAEAEFPFERVDVQDIPEAERETATHRLATTSARRPFDLGESVFRVTLYRLSPTHHLLLWNMHCIVCDGTSSDLFYQDLTHIYAAFSAGQPSPLPDLPVQYADYAHWQRQWLQGDTLERYLNYWKQELAGDLPPMTLPTDHLRPVNVQTYRGDRYARMFSPELLAQLTQCSQQWGSTLFTTLLSAFEVVLYRYAQQPDLVLSFVSNGRIQVETENIIGFFSNSLVLRSQIQPTFTFRDLLQQVHQKTLEAYRYQDLPFEELIEEIRPGNRAQSSLFQVKFTLNPPWTKGNGMAPIELPGLSIESLFGYIYHGKTKFDMILVMREQEQGLGTVFDYNAELFDESTIARLMDHLQSVLESIIVDPEQAIAQIPLLTAAEQQMLSTLGTQLGTQPELIQSIKDMTLENGSILNQLLDVEQLPNAELCILDAQLQAVPLGVFAHLYISSTATSSAVSALVHPILADRWLHPTGAIARFKSDGSGLEFQPPETATEATETYVASRNDLEQQLVTIWLELLNLERVGICDNFFELGGNSILAVRLFNQIEATFGKTLPLSTLLAAPTIEKLSRFLHQETSDDERWSPLVEIQAGDPTLPPLFCIHGGGFNILIYRDLALNLDEDQPVYGLQAQGLDGRSVRDRLEDLASDYISEIRRVQSHGPYYLAGLSNGGNIALEMAQQLQAMGESVGLLALFDSYAPNSITLMPTLPRFYSAMRYAVQHTLPRVIPKLMRRLGDRQTAPNLQSVLEKVNKLPRKLQDNLQPEDTHPSTSHPSIETSDRAQDTIKSQIKRSLNSLSQYILDHSSWAFLTPQRQVNASDGKVSETLQTLESTYAKVHAAYCPQPYEGCIILFRASETAPGFAVDPELGWGEIAQQGVVVYRIPGDHTSIMRSPRLAERLQTLLYFTRATDPPEASSNLDPYDFINPEVDPHIASISSEYSFSPVRIAD
jgi:thioesterase domain-containing protein/acyl carrier protein